MPADYLSPHSASATLGTAGRHGRCSCCPLEPAPLSSSLMGRGEITIKGYIVFSDHKWGRDVYRTEGLDNERFPALLINLAACTTSGKGDCVTTNSVLVRIPRVASAGHADWQCGSSPQTNKQSWNRAPLQSCPPWRRMNNNDGIGASFAMMSQTQCVSLHVKSWMP